MKKKNFLMAAMIITSLSVTAQKVTKNDLFPVGTEVREVNVLELEKSSRSIVQTTNKDMRVISMDQSSQLISPAAQEEYVAAYEDPQGTLYTGLSEDFYILDRLFAFNAAYSTWTWKNISNVPASASSSWSYSDGSQTHVSSDKDLSFNVETGSFTFPTLTTNSSSYTNGANFDFQGNPGVIYAGGGSIESNGRLFNLTNANFDYERVSWQFTAGNYLYGTGTYTDTSGKPFSTNALLSLYDKPLSTLYFEGVNVFLGSFSAPASTEFKLYIVTTELNKNGFPILKDTIGVSTITAADVQTYSASAYTMPFFNFVALDEDGFETQLDYIEIEDQFVLMLTGYNQPNVTLSVTTEYQERPDENVKSFFMYETEEARYTGNWTGSYYRMHMSLVDSYYSYVHSEESQVIIGSTGGSKTFTLRPYFNIAVLEESTAVNWINVSFNDHYTQDNWGTDVTLQLSALPAGVTGRDAVLEFRTIGAYTHVHVIQSDNPDNISSIDVSTINANYNNNNFELTYPEGVNSVTIINSAGQSVGSYSLPQDGSVNIPAAQLAKGIYLLKFDGAINTTVKVAR